MGAPSGSTFMEENVYMRDCRLEEAFLLACEGIQSSAKCPDLQGKLLTFTENPTKIIGDVEWKGIDSDTARRFKIDINFSLNFCLECIRRISFEVFPSQDFIRLSSIMQSKLDNDPLRYDLFKKVLTCPISNNFRGRVLFNNLMISLHFVSRAMENLGASTGFKKVLNLFASFLLPPSQTALCEISGNEQESVRLKDAQNILAFIVLVAPKIFNEDGEITASDTNPVSEICCVGALLNGNGAQRASIFTDLSEGLTLLRSHSGDPSDRLPADNAIATFRAEEASNPAAGIGTLAAERNDDLPDVSAVSDTAHDVGYVSDTASAQSTQLGELDPRAIAQPLVSTVPTPPPTPPAPTQPRAATSQPPVLPPLNGLHERQCDAHQVGGGQEQPPTIAASSARPSPSLRASAAVGGGQPSGPPVPPGPAAGEAQASCALNAAAAAPVPAGRTRQAMCDFPVPSGHQAAGRAATDAAAGRRTGPPSAPASRGGDSDADAGAGVRPAAHSRVPAPASTSARDERSSSDGPAAALAPGLPRSVARMDSGAAAAAAAAAAAGQAAPPAGAAPSSGPARRPLPRRDSDMGEPPVGGCGLLRWLRPRSFQRLEERLATFRGLAQVPPSALRGKWGGSVRASGGRIGLGCQTGPKGTGPVRRGPGPRPRSRVPGSELQV